MSSRIISLIFLLGLLPAVPLWAQGENNIWCFGHRAGLNFNGSGPTFFEHNMEVKEGCASVSTPAGSLLFYTSGSKVWDRNGNLMPNGTGLAGNTFSSMNGVAIVQSVSNPDQYYVITTDEMESGLHNAYYSVVDMSLNGGLGDAIPAQSSILIDTGLAEGVAVTSMPGCTGYWAVFHRSLSSIYLAYRIDAWGVATSPVLSAGTPSPPALPGFHSRWIFNNVGNRLVRCQTQQIETAAFDNTTGIFSGFSLFTVPLVGGFYSAFSPDDHKFYISGIQATSPYVALYQLDLSLLPNIAAVQNSSALVANTASLGMRLGPDNKIYIIAPGNSSYLMRINNPNATGMACNLDATFMSWPSYAAPPQSNNLPNFYELGSRVVTPRLDSLSSAKDSVLCFETSATFKAAPGYFTYRWNTGDTSRSITATQGGTYWVAGRKDCYWHTDSFHLVFENISIDLGPDTFICNGQIKILDATQPGAGYLWQDGSANTTYTVDRTGTYRVTVSRNGCTATDTIHIDEVLPSLNISEPDTTICNGTAITLHTSVQPAGQFLWSNGSTADQIQVTEAGSYAVTATNACGTLTDEVTITTIDCNCDRPFVPNAFTPNGDDKNEILKVHVNCPGVHDFYFAVYNRYGQRVFESKNIDEGWNGLHNGHKADIGTHFYRLQYKTGEGREIKKKGDVTLLH